MSTVEIETPKVKLDADAHKAKVEADDEAIDRKGNAEKEAKVVAAAAKDAEKTSVHWQCKYRNYHTLTPVETGRVTPGTQSRVHKVVRAHEFRIILNMDNPEDKKVNEYLLKSDRRGVDFWLVEEAVKGKKSETIQKRASTLRKLNEMSQTQLTTMLEMSEWTESGINPAMSDKYEMIMAIIDKKRLSQGE